MKAIDKVRQMVADGQVSQEVAEKYFPELKERDGGKIRERLIAFLTQCKAVYGDSFKQFELNIDEALDWLEKQGENISLPKFTYDDVLALQCAMGAARKVQKDEELYEQLESLHDRIHDAYWIIRQGEQKPNLDVVIPFGAKDSELKEASYNIPDGYHAEIEDNKVVIKKGEQKPWSEEDDDMLYKVTTVINRLCAEGEEYVWSIKTLNKLFYWLKFLKDRVQPQSTWKPSKEQMNSIRDAIDYLGCTKTVRGYLVSLYEDLKKLREK